MMKKMIALLICLFLCGSAIAVGAASDDAALQKECQNDVQKVMTCLDFAKGSAARPSKECCNSMTDIRARDGKCLCFIIKETQGGQGGEMLKSLGVDKTKLLQLPSACQLKNASISDCPKLLGISPSSPDAAVFNSNVSTPTTSTSPGTKSSPDTAGNSNAAAKYGSNLVTPMTVTAMGVFAYGFPTGFASMIYSWV